MIKYYKIILEFYDVYIDKKCILIYYFYKTFAFQTLRGRESVKSTGIVRKVDDLGRIVLPIELRKIMDIEPRDSLEIFVDGDTIMLKKYEPQCIFCGSSDGIKTFYDKSVCSSCAKNIASDI